MKRERALAIIVMMANDNYLDVTTLCWPRALGAMQAAHTPIALADHCVVSRYVTFRFVSLRRDNNHDDGGRDRTKSNGGYDDDDDDASSGSCGASWVIGPDGRETSQ